MDQNSARGGVAKQSLAKTVGKLMFWLWLVVLPVSIAFVLWIGFRLGFDSVSDESINRAIPKAAEEIISSVPFFSVIGKLFFASYEVKAISFSTIIDAVLKSLLIYNTVDAVKRLQSMEKDTARVETKAVKLVKVYFIYGTGVILTSFILELITKDGFALVQKYVPAKIDWDVLRIALLLLLLWVSVSAFHRRNQGSPANTWLLSILWVTSEKIVFPCAAMLILAVFAQWAYWGALVNATSMNVWLLIFEKLAIPLLIYVLVAAGLDYLKQLTRRSIVSMNFKLVSRRKNK